MIAKNGKAYWRSLGELQDTPEFRQFVEREFPVAASEFPEGVSRRRWMQLMGASLALGGLAGCRWEAEKIAPFAMRPENRIPGKPEYFATSLEIGGMPRHLLVTCYDGRPIKVEGNPEHPASRGASDLFSQATILELYDPDRSDALRQREGRQVFTRRWEDFRRFAKGHFADLQRRGGQGLAVLTRPSSSLSLHAMLRQVRERFPRAQLYSYAPISFDNEIRGTQLAFNRPLRARLNLQQANVIACLDADLLGIHPHATAHAREFAQRRDPSGGMNRLYVVESQFSVTGAAADHRLPQTSHRIGLILAHLDVAVRGKLELAVQDDLPALTSSQQAFVQALADDLVANRGSSVVAVGRSQPPEVHALAYGLNDALGNLGTTLEMTEDLAFEASPGTLKSLVAAARENQIDTLLILGGNPVYDAPGDLRFAEALKSITTTLRLGTYEDETSQCCTWHLPEAHAYEVWSDVRGSDGSISVVQPLIAPLLNGKSPIEVLEIILQGSREPEIIVRQAVTAALGGKLADDKWNRLLHDGFLDDTSLPHQQVTAKLDRAAVLSQISSRASANLEVVFTAGDAVLDGRFANNGWLQETPEFLTKLTWDNAAIISPATAKQLGIDHETLVQLKRGATEITLPAFVLPGQADGSIGIAIGYGRRAAGVVGGQVRNQVNPVGVDVNPLRRMDALDFVDDIEVIPTGEKYGFATTQDHHAIDTVGLEETGRRVGQLVREGTWEEYQQHPDFAQHATHHNPLESLWQEPSYDGHAWGMSIDLNKCIGCNACMVACQAENNVPIVGKEQVAKGREMHWLRVDRYFTGDVENPRIAMQPVACHHCENAPCEQVCPVAATVHSDEGLNDMVYNRCIGTRYCANNCPYKVRRFNFFNYNKDLEEPESRTGAAGHQSRGHRPQPRRDGEVHVLRAANSRRQDRREERSPPIRDGEIKTACQQACPTQAIEFGDLNESESRVATAHADPRLTACLPN